MRDMIYMGALPVFLLLWTGCGSAPDKVDTADTGATAETDTDTDTGHDCMSYEPTEQVVDLSGDWSDLDDEDWYEVTAPADPGGGLVSLSIRADNGSDIPWLDVFHGSPEGRPLYSGSNAAGATPSVLDVAFEVAASESFHIKTRLRGGSVGLPSAYTMTWSFDSKVDCYESNNEESDARLVPLNTPLEAYLFGGHRAQYLYDDDFFDWYAFEVDETSEVTILTTQMPSDQWVGLMLYDEMGARLGEWGGGDYGALTSSTALVLDPGRYTFLFDPLYVPEGVVGPGDVADVDHWATKHQFTIQAIPE